MAESPSHRFGQYIGNLLEILFLPEVEQFCQQHGLYLDKHGARPARTGKKATWVDEYGNSHDLDFVIEKGGTAAKHGRPLAFIEAAWRRYTKHSRNKAQEIQGAVLPLAERFKWDKPFMGALLAGCFTEPTLTQLKSMGFDIVYIQYEALIGDFAALGVDIRFDERTSHDWFVDVMAQIEAGGAPLQSALVRQISQTNRNQFDEFFARLKAKLVRHIDFLIVVPLYGDEHKFGSVTDALAFVTQFKSSDGTGTFRGFEIVVGYSNGDVLRGNFASARDAESFLFYLTS